MLLSCKKIINRITETGIYRYHEYEETYMHGQIYDSGAELYISNILIITLGIGYTYAVLLFLTEIFYVLLETNIYNCISQVVIS